MPDAYGNLLGIEDFTTGRRIRLHSYIDPDVVLGCLPGAEGGIQVHRLSSGTVSDSLGDVTVWGIVAQPGGAFRLARYNARGAEWQHLGFYSTPDGVMMTTYEAYVLYGNDRINFTVDFVDGPWFALNTWDRTRVVDIARSHTAEGSMIIGYTWNGGDNQRWRAQVV